MDNPGQALLERIDRREQDLRTVDEQQHLRQQPEWYPPMLWIEGTVYLRLDVKREHAELQAKRQVIHRCLEALTHPGALNNAALQGQLLNDVLNVLAMPFVDAAS